jgi:dienelactone hydrolase
MAHQNRKSLISNIQFAVARLLILSLMVTGVALAQNPVPLINQPLVPDTVAPGGKGFRLTVNGTGFVSGSTVNWNGSALATSFVSGSQLKATVPASDIAKASTASVTVVNPSPGGGTSNEEFFQVMVTGLTTSLGQSNIPVGALTEREAVGDFNRDGKLDLAVQDPSGVWILLGNGDGTFQTPVLYSVPGGTGYLITGDFNNDGKLDVAGLGAGIVTILLGNGNGTFQPHVDSAIDTTIPNPFSIAAGDLNHDGKLDLVVGYQGGSAVSVLLGNGDGTFQPFVDYATAAEPNAVAIGDFNRDGKLDVATANFGSFGGKTVSILLGNGDGTFQPHVEYPTDGGPLSVVAADFNGDGKLDLAVDCSCGHSSTCGRPGTVSILLGNGDGTFQRPVNYDADEFPYTIAAGDFNGDGKIDLALTDLDSGKISFLLGNGDGTFQSHFELPTNARPVGLATGDFNDDGTLDLVVGGSNPEQVAMMLQVGTVGLKPPSLNFGVQLIRTRSAEQKAVLSNVGNATLNISSIAITGTNPGDFDEQNNCPASLPAGSHCTIKVTFEPTDFGPRSAAVTITDDAPGSPQSVRLTGIGVHSGPNATLSPQSLTFATQLVGSTSPAQPVTLSNYGTEILDITSIVASGDFDESNNCNSSLPPGRYCTMDVTFTPTQRGSRRGTVTITDNAPNSPQKVHLTGMGTVVTLQPASLNFGRVPIGHNSSPQPVTLTNTANTALHIMGIAVTGANAGDFSQQNNCPDPGYLGGGKSCTINVTFTPTQHGNRSANLSVSDNGGGSPQQVSLSGYGCTIHIHKCVEGDDSLRGKKAQSALIAHQAPALPSVTGTSRIGTRVLDLVDPTRIDPFVSDGSKRELLVRFWYPAFLNQACEPAQYTSSEVWSYFSELTGLPLPEVRTNSCWNAPITDDAHPVVVFTHGYTGTFTDYTFLFEDLASRGYVVASVDHTHEATAVEFPDGRFVKSVVGNHFQDTWRMDEKTLSLALSVRSADLKFVLDELSRLNGAADGPFAGKLDTSRVGLMGHSLGGEATITSLAQETRFKAGVLLEAVLKDGSLGKTDTPTLILAAGRERWSENECKLWGNLRGPRLAVNFRGAEHLTPTDAVWLAKYAIKTGTMGPEKTVEALRNYIAAFLDAKLAGKPADPLLSGLSTDYPDAAVTTQKQSLCGEAIDH